MAVVLCVHSADAKTRDKQQHLKTTSTDPLGPGIVNLGTAGNFAILAKTGVSTVPNSVITGDVGVSPISQGGLTGFSLKAESKGTRATSDQVTGDLWAADYTAPTPTKMTTAIGDMETAYTDAMGRTTPDHVDFATGALGGQTLAPGLYKFATSVGITSDCTISGSSTDTWIFQIAKDLGIDANTNIILAGGALAKNIVWTVAGATTHGAGSHFEGIILGKTASSFFTGSSINGRVLVQTAVTLQKTTVTSPAE